MPPTRYDEFSQYVRRFRPSEVLPEIALTSVGLLEPWQWREDRWNRYPWALAGIARTSIVASNEYRSRHPRSDDIARMCELFNNLSDPFVRHGSELQDSLASFLVRVGFQQFPYQSSMQEQIPRTAAIFDELNEIPTKIITPTFLEETLGCSIDDYLAASFVIWCAAWTKPDRFHPDMLISDEPESIDSVFPTSTVRTVFDRHYTTTIEQFREKDAEGRQVDPLLRQFEYNPLVGSPFVELSDGAYVAPVVQLVRHKMSVDAIYYAVLGALTTRSDAGKFTEDLGFLFKHYVGRQLKLLPDVEVLGEIEYEPSKKSVDWFVIFDDLVVLVEAKSTPLTEGARHGREKLHEDLERTVGHAYQQIDNTNRLIESGHPKFSRIPTDRPRCGLVVTRQPYWGSDSTPGQAHIENPSAIPSRLASVNAIEQHVCRARAYGSQVFKAVVSGSRDETVMESTGIPSDCEPNPILDAVWARLPFGDGDD